MAPPKTVHGLEKQTPQSEPSDTVAEDTSRVLVAVPVMPVIAKMISSSFSL